MSALEILSLVAIGLGVGAYSGAIGAGGGFLVAPVLLWRHSKVPPEAITVASLSVAALVSGMAAGFGLRDGRVDRSLALMLACVAVGGALGGAAITTMLPRRVFALGFAAALSVVATYLIWRPAIGAPTPGAPGWRRLHRDREGSRFFYRVPLPRSMATGFLVGGWPRSPASVRGSSSLPSRRG